MRRKENDAFKENVPTSVKGPAFKSENARAHTHTHFILSCNSHNFLTKSTTNSNTLVYFGFLFFIPK